MILSLSAALAAPTHAQLETAQWTTVSESKHWAVGQVTLSMAEVEGESCFRAVTQVGDVELDRLFAVAKDPVSAVRWSSAKITESEWLTRTDELLEYYQYLDVAIVSDRFWFVRATMEQAEGRRVVRWSPLPSDTDHKGFVTATRTRHASAVELSVNIGGWYLTAVDDGIQVAYQVCSRSGTLARWIQDKALKGALPSTVGDLVAEARRR
ncbi:MAG: hypothetical protein AAGA48_06910 [Myxococcota bacterium]